MTFNPYPKIAGKNRFSNFISKNRQLVEKLISAIGDQAVFAGGNFIINVALARWMSIEEYGTFVLAYSWFLLFLSYYDAVIAEPMGVYGAGKYEAHFSTYIGYLYYIHSVFTFLAFVITVGISILVSRYDSISMGHAMLGVAIALPFITLRWITRRPFYVLSQPIWSAIGGVIYILVTVSLVLGLHYIDVVNTNSFSVCPALLSVSESLCLSLNTSSLLTPFSVIILMSIGSLVSSGILIVFVLRPTWRSQNKNFKIINVVKDHMSYGKWSGLNRFLIWFMVNIYYVVLPLTASLAATGALKALMNLIMPVHLATAAVTALLTPIFVRAYKKNGKAGVTKDLKRYIVIISMICVPYFFIMIFFGKQVMTLLYDGQFDDIVTLPNLILMGLLPVLTAITRTFDSAILAMGGVKKVFLSKLIPGAITIFIGMPLLVQYGLLGANISALLSAIAGIFVLIYYYKNFSQIVQNPE